MLKEKGIKGNYGKDARIEKYLFEDKLEAESKPHKKLSRAM